MLQQQTQSPGWRVLNRDVIKYIAMTAMLLNHIANIFLVPGTLWYEVLVDIGYFTAITMCYFLVEGFRYTHSRKQYALQMEVCDSVAAQLAAGEERIMGVMVESHLCPGRQDLTPGQELTYGQSITDACIGWEDSLAVLERLAAAVRARRLVKAD